MLHGPGISIHPHCGEPLGVEIDAYSRMTSLTRNGGSTRVSLEPLADLDVPATAPPPDEDADVMEKEKEEEGVAEQKTRKSKM